jgi:hypothetical protein
MVLVPPPSGCPIDRLVANPQDFRKTTPGPLPYFDPQVDDPVAGARDIAATTSHGDGRRQDPHRRSAA